MKQIERNMSGRRAVRSPLWLYIVSYLNVKVVHNLQEVVGQWQVLRPALFSKHGFVTAALIASPSPLYLRHPKGGAVTHLLH